MAEIELWRRPVNPEVLAWVSGIAALLITFWGALVIAVLRLAA